MDEQKVRSMLAFYESTGDRKSEFEMNCALAFQYNDPEACYKVATMARDGFINPGPEEKKFYVAKCMEKAADLGCSEAMLEYSKMLYNGNYIKKDLEKSEKYLKMAMGKGNAEAIFERAVRLDQQIGRDEEVLYFLKLSAELGSTNAAYNVGRILLDRSRNYIRGESQKTNREIAIRYFTQAADAGDLMAKYALNSIREEDFRKKIEERCKIIEEKNIHQDLTIVEENVEILKRENKSAIHSLPYIQNYGSELYRSEKSINEGVMETTRELAENKAKRELIDQLTSIGLTYKKISMGGHKQALDDFKRIGKEIESLYSEENKVKSLA